MTSLNCCNNPPRRRIFIFSTIQLGKDIWYIHWSFIRRSRNEITGSLSRSELFKRWCNHSRGKPVFCEIEEKVWLPDCYSDTETWKRWLNKWTHGASRNLYLSALGDNEFMKIALRYWVNDEEHLKFSSSMLLHFFNIMKLRLIVASTYNVAAFHTDNDKKCGWSYHALTYALTTGISFPVVCEAKSCERVKFQYSGNLFFILSLFHYFIISVSSRRNSALVFSPTVRKSCKSNGTSYTTIRWSGMWGSCTNVKFVILHWSNVTDTDVVRVATGAGYDFDVKFVMEVACFLHLPPQCLLATVVFVKLALLRVQLHPEWQRITWAPSVGVGCAKLSFCSLSISFSKNYSFTFQNKQNVSSEKYSITRNMSPCKITTS